MKTRFARIALMLCLLAIGLFAAGCGGDEPAAAQNDSNENSIPAGVVAQYETLAHEIASEGGEQTSGQWKIGYIVEGAEGWFERHGDEYEWRAPAGGETHHLEIIPMEANTGRIVPGAEVTLTVLDGQEQVAQRRLTQYYAEFFHFADNFAIPKPGTYSLRAEIKAPPYRRHGEEGDSPALTEDVTVQFDGVELE